jgi:hypothetical protein
MRQALTWAVHKQRLFVSTYLTIELICDMHSTLEWYWMKVLHSLLQKPIITYITMLLDTQYMSAATRFYYQGCLK